MRRLDRSCRGCEPNAFRERHSARKRGGIGAVEHITTTGRIDHSHHKCRMMDSGAAPAPNFDIRAVDGRFEIVWLTDAPGLELADAAETNL